MILRYNNLDNNWPNETNNPKNISWPSYLIEEQNRLDYIYRTTWFGQAICSF